MPRQPNAPFRYVPMLLIDEKNIPASATGVVNLYLTTRNELVFVREDGTIVRFVYGHEPCVAGVTLQDKMAVYQSALDGKWYPIDLMAVGISRRRGIVNNKAPIPAGSTGLVCIDGVVEGFSGPIPGGLVYASTTAGGITQVRPVLTLNGAQTVLAIMGTASEDGKRIVVSSASQDIIYQLRASNIANGGTRVITHHADSDAPTRQIFAYLSTNANVTIASYPVSNMDNTATIANPLSNAIAQPFTLTSAATLSTMRVYLSKTGLAADTLSCAIYTNSGGFPGTLVGTASNTVSVAGLTSSLTATDFTFANLSLAANTGYWLVLSTTGLLTVGTCLVGADKTVPPASPGYAAQQSLGLIWSTMNPNTTLIFEALSAQGTLLSQGYAIGLGATGIRWTATSTTSTTLTNGTGGTITDVTFSVIVR